MQNDLDRREEWVYKNLMKFHKDKCKVLNLGKHNPGLQHRLGSTWLGTSSVERDLGVLVDKPSMSDERAAAAKTDIGMLGYINKDITSRDKDVIVPLYSALVRPHLEHCVQFWPLLYKKRWGQAGEGPEKDQKDDPSVGKPHNKRLRDLGLFNLEKRQLRGDLITSI